MSFLTSKRNICLMKIVANSAFMSYMYKETSTKALYSITIGAKAVTVKFRLYRGNTCTPSQVENYKL